MVYIVKKQFPARVKLYRALLATYGLGMTRVKTLVARYGGTLRVRISQLNRKKIRHLNRFVSRRYILGHDLKRIAQRVIKAHKLVGSYKGLRFKQGLPSNGQRTRSNANTCRRFKLKKRKSAPGKGKKR